MTKRKRSNPKMGHMIPYSRQNIDESDVRAVANALRSPFLTQGPAVESFEKSLAKKTGARFAVAFSSGTAALHAAYFVAGIGRGDEVILPALTFAATANAALYLGAKPVFADIDPATGNLDPKEVEKKITKKTKAIVPVDYAGRPAELASFRAIARKHKLLLIEDAAQALGADYKGKPIGSWSDMTMFSFHPVKSITTGEGGAITTNSKIFYEKLCLFRTHGITKDTKRMSRSRMPAWYQEMQVLGFNYRLTDIQAALGESQLQRLDRFINERQKLAKQYHQLLGAEAGLILPPVDEKNIHSAWHLYPVRLAPARVGSRDKIFVAMRKAGIGVQVHHVPVYLHPFYSQLGYTKGTCPKTEWYVDAELSLPLFPGLSEREQRFVVKILLAILNKQ